MGTKRTGRRKYLFLYIACGITLLLAIGACKAHTVTRPEERDLAVDQVHSSSTDSPSQNTIASPAVSDENNSEHLHAAYLALGNQNYTSASREVEMAIIEDAPSLRPEIIYLAGLLHADPKNPTGDVTMARESFQEIEKEHPDSNRAGEVRILIDLLQTQQSLQSENRRLHQEVSQLKKKLIAEQNSVQRLKGLLNKMKEIDLGIMPEEQ